MSTGLFADEEDGYNLEETKYVLKGSAPSTDSSVEAIEEPIDEPMDEPMDDLEGLEDAPADEKPFDDEPFDAGVDADEDTDPAKYIQQLSGKLGQSLRQYSEDEGQPDFDLEKFAVNSVLSATHTGEMDKEDQRDIINQVKGAGEDEGGDAEVDVDADLDVDADVDADIEGGEDEFGSEEEVEEIVEELPLNKGDELPIATDCSMGMEPIDDDALAALKSVAELKESDSPCWDGYERVPNTKLGDKGSCRKKANESLTETKLNEGTWQNIMKGVRKAPQGPFSVVVIQDGKVIDQAISIDNPQLIPANYGVMRRKYPMAKISIENGEGLIVYREGRLKESKNNRIFVDKANLIKNLRLMENAEPMVEPKPITKPTTKPARPMRETERPFSPKRRVDVQPDPKAEDNDMLTDNE
jgi:hypothetical protein